MKRVNVVIEKASDGGYGAWSLAPNQGIHAIGASYDELWENLIDAANDSDKGKVFIREDFEVSYDIESYIRYYWERARSFFRARV